MDEQQPSPRAFAGGWACRRGIATTGT